MTIRDRREARAAPERDPGQRKRLDAEQMRRRDAQVARLLKARVPFRTIAERLDMSLGSVQKTVLRLRAAPAARERKVRTPAHRSRFAVASDDW